MLRPGISTIVVLVVLALAGFSASSPEAKAQSAADAQSLRQAMAAVDEGDYEAALAIAGSLEDPALSRLVQWRRLMREGTRVGFGELADFVEAYPHWPGSSTLRGYAEEALPAHLTPDERIEWFRRFPPETGAGALAFARALRSKRHAEEADQEALAAWRDMSLPATVESAFLAEFGHVIGPEEILARVERGLQNNSSAAISMAARVSDGHQRVAEARLRLSQMQAGVDSAVERVPPHLQDDPGLLHERARWRMRSDFYEGAVELLDPAPPVTEQTADHWWQIKHWVARRALSQGQADVAYRIASNHGATRGITLAEGEFLSGWIALRFLNDPEQAYRHFDRLYHNVSMPISLARGAYWAGEAASAMGRADWATQWYRVAAQYDTVFYGQMAALHLGSMPTGVLEATAAITPAQQASFNDLDLVRVTRALALLQREDLLPYFFAALRSNASSAVDYKQVGLLAQELGYPEQVIRTGRAALVDGHQLSDLLYPAPVVDLSNDPNGALLLGLMRQESAFNLRAVSPAGARGLMQLMPGTAEQVARRLGISYSIGRLTSDPHYNITLGRDYLERMLDRYSGFLPLALAAYNAGPGRADQWIQQYGDPRSPNVDPIDWMELIPFSETRNYVQRVLESYTVYHRRLHPERDPFVALPLPVRYSPESGETLLRN